MPRVISPCVVGITRLVIVVAAGNRAVLYVVVVAVVMAISVILIVLIVASKGCRVEDVAEIIYMYEKMNPIII